MEIPQGEGSGGGPAACPATCPVSCHALSTRRDAKHAATRRASQARPCCGCGQAPPPAAPSWLICPAGHACLPAGFVWDKDGHIVTNYHVIRGASEVLVSSCRGAGIPRAQGARALVPALGQGGCLAGQRLCLPSLPRGARPKGLLTWRFRLGNLAQQGASAGRLLPGPSAHPFHPHPRWHRRAGSRHSLPSASTPSVPDRLALPCPSYCGSAPLYTCLSSQRLPVFPGCADHSVGGRGPASQGGGLR